jgi:hypothetical protein
MQRGWGEPHCINLVLDGAAFERSVVAGRLSVLAKLDNHNHHRINYETYKYEEAI